MLAWLDKALQAWREPAPGLVLWLGAGQGEALPQLLELGAARIVLVEGHPDLAARLQRRVDGLAAAGRVTVRAEVVAPHAGEVDWHVLEPARFSGPLAPTALRLHYPRMRESGQRRATAIGLPELLQQVLDAHAPTERPALLVLDLPGQEAALLDTCDKPLLQRFDGVLLHGCAEPLWDGARRVDEASAVMARRGFKARLVDRQSEPLWPLVEVVVDKQKVEIERLQWRLERAQLDLEQVRAQAEQLQQLLDEAELRSQQAERGAAQAAADLQALREARQGALETAQAHWQTIELLTEERDLARRQLEAQAAAQPAAPPDPQATPQAPTASAELQRLHAELEALGRQQALALEQVEAERQRADEAWQRVQQLGNELALAEGQLELVKDLLLDDPQL